MRAMHWALMASVLLISCATHEGSANSIQASAPAEVAPMQKHPDRKAATGSVIRQIPEPEQLDQTRIVTFKVTGQGVAPETSLTRGQGRILAGRAAIADGYRQFVEKLSGVYVETFTRAGLSHLGADQIQISVKAMLRGVEIKEIVHDEYGIAKANMELSINFTEHGMMWWPKGLGKDVMALKRESN